MSECICSRNDKYGHSDYCPVWMRERITKLEAVADASADLYRKWDGTGWAVLPFRSMGNALHAAGYLEDGE